jgi:hypothetical protein
MYPFSPSSADPSYITIERLSQFGNSSRPTEGYPVGRLLKRSS